MVFPVAQLVKNPFAKAGDTRDTGSVPRSGRFPGGRNGNPFQYSCLENPMNRGVCRLQSMGSQTVRYDLAAEHTMLCISC